MLTACSDSDSSRNETDQISESVTLLQASAWRVESITASDGVTIDFIPESNYTATYQTIDDAELLYLSFGCRFLVVDYDAEDTVINYGPYVTIDAGCEPESPAAFDDRLRLQEFFNNTSLMLDEDDIGIRHVRMDNSSLMFQPDPGAIPVDENWHNEVTEKHWVLREYQINGGSMNAVSTDLPVSLYLSENNPDFPYFSPQLGTISCAGMDGYIVTPSVLSFTTTPADRVACLLPDTPDSAVFWELIGNIIQTLNNATVDYDTEGQALTFRTKSGDQFEFGLAADTELSEIESALSTRL